MTMLLVVLELKLLFCFIVTPPRRAGAQVRLVSVAHTRTVGLAPLLGQRHCLLLAIMWCTREDFTVWASLRTTLTVHENHFSVSSSRSSVLEGGIHTANLKRVTEKNKAVLYTPMSRLYTLYRL